MNVEINQFHYKRTFLITNQVGRTRQYTVLLGGKREPPLDEPSAGQKLPAHDISQLMPFPPHCSQYVPNPAIVKLHGIQSLQSLEEGSQRADLGLTQLSLFLLVILRH